MTTRNEHEDATRQAANVLLDAVSAFDDKLGESPVNEAAIKLALERLTDIPAFTLTYDDEAETHTLTADPLIGGALNVIKLAVGTLALAHNADQQAVINTLREQL